ncbi:type I-C CRISPR-associated endonuclease Cas1c [Spirulina subsalsa]|uniref:type I-C CRISPR-associated endonuclease Cas1c n=1 Tax=Spirulina subsalsa TaxID=54311 RepID=UPI00031250EB|nr:type I-C CRISPR-associated endonuclease Cas1c [Spirulina subsalsa]
MKPILNTLYVQTQGAYLHLERDTLKLKAEEQKPFQIPLHHLTGLVVFGNVSVSPFLLHRCAQDGRDFVWLSEYGKFKARLSGPTTGNVLLRRAQNAAVDDGAKTLDIARYMVAGKIQNARKLLMRSARDAKQEGDRTALTKAAQHHAESLTRLEAATTVETVRGIEGNAAKAYLEVFDHAIVQNREAFGFKTRSRHPPLDPTNSLLSFLYGLLKNECIAACESVGLDPQMGFLHVLRPGRASLAFDLMEELRPIVCDRLVLTLINRQQIQPDDFMERPGGAIYLTESGRKTVLGAYQKRKQEEITHPLLKTKIPLGLVAHTQARLFARYLRGDLDHYPPFIPR